MSKLAYLIIFQLFFIAVAHAQTINGIVKDANTHENMAFVNVGIIGKTKGTVTNDAGMFSLGLSNNSTDSLRISMVGYVPQTYLVADFLKRYPTSASLMLQPQVKALREVKIVNRKYKQAVFGNRTTSQSTTAGFTSNLLGNEIGTVIKIKRSPTYLKQFTASLAEADVDSVKLRLNIYSLKNGMPDQPLLQQNLIVQVKQGQKSINVNLEPYHIMVEDNFFVSLEWIQNARGHGLMFSASLFSSPMISRANSQANWEKIGFAGIGMNVLAEY
ncbi:hypothetical protein GCM10027037_02500 [Mucilaginibacter koreensis]